MVKRFANIELDSRQLVMSKANIKNELLIITTRDDLFQLWAEFVTAHAAGELVNPDTKDKFNKSEKFKQNQKFLLHREFFKRLGHMTDDMMLEKLVVHLLGQTPRRVVQYPKVIVHKIQSVLPFTYATSDWLERRKRKIIVI